MEPNPTVMSKKLYNMLRIALFMIQKGVSKTKFMFDVHLMIKRGKILGKALNDLMVEQHHNLSCVSHDVHMSFISPREYEFSCTSHSSSLKPYNRFHANRRRTHYHHRKRQQTCYHVPPYIWGDKASEGGDATEAAASPLVGLGFGWSPLVRQVRITDSPFTSLRNSDRDQDCIVDMEAEKFIQRFYRELRLQKWMAAREATENHYG
ncbi:hypothetical protein JCGZ_07738 [Jatropha curcas]|uniref:Avr9/Cf-9 rapidly elicited protein 146 n=1 Tax=Jatropha curcas TaxID=180498 RepID=A0A067KDH2_JATCU|nr:hypothetical protein JCGZ_07738 [Jatropha curcas]